MSDFLDKFAQYVWGREPTLVPKHSFLSHKITVGIHKNDGKMSRNVAFKSNVVSNCGIFYRSFNSSTAVCNPENDKRNRCRYHQTLASPDGRSRSS